ncbi:DUF1501 domain-containing protein [Actomonas aquatica]|uniref:DUF1501 domain-containing protein n=1 Tax=Actomonas aquatica TaxID=2866162 RepID=A0ABZ1CBM4_9BACT|nr:DUF1501 domain-containing protein [Opitutus sp. WL0086]WRQ88984.1 DUF1501 domain-containing protein [Opitutus sp. WL0086]
MSASFPSDFPTTRREFLRTTGSGIGLLTFAQFAPAFLVNSVRAAAPSPERDRTILVLVQLAGGNDGLNTVVPFANDHYHRLRPSLGLTRQAVLPINDELGLHPACRELYALHQDGQLGIIQNVGYPNPNRSHFRSTEIWETASEADDTLSTGWLGRYLDNACAGADAATTSADPAAIHVSGETPPSFASDADHAIFGVPERPLRRSTRNRRNTTPTDVLEAFARSPDHAHDDDHSNHAFLRATAMNALVTERRVEKVLAAYRPGAAYPTDNRFAQSLQKVAAMIAAGFDTRVYFVSLGGFDTHANQAGAHQNLLATLSGGLAAFQADLTAHGLADQVLTTTFSEFGRRPAENESGGTDHGTAAPLFVLGSKLDQTLLGAAPDLDLPSPKADLTYSTDFRSVYATLLDRWLEADADAVLGQRFDRLAFL